MKQPDRVSRPGAGMTRRLLPSMLGMAALAIAAILPVHAIASGLAGKAAALAAPAQLAPMTVSSRYYTPGRGSPERSQIMDAARGPIMRELQVPVIFVVQTLRSDGNWVYLQAEPRNPDGSQLNWYQTPFARDWANDAMSDVIMVLLRRDGSGFIVVDYVIGPTDVAWYEWLQAYSLPEALFHQP